MLKQEYYLQLYQEIDSYLQFADEKGKEAEVNGLSKWDIINNTDYLNALKMKQDLVDKIKM